MRVDAPASFIGCVRSPFNTVQWNKFPLGVSIGTFPREVKTDSTSLELNHLTIYIREDHRLKRVRINVISCPKNTSLEACIYDYSPTKFLKDILHRNPQNFSPSQSLSLAQGESHIVTKLMEDMQLVPDRVLGLVVDTREYTPEINTCSPLEFYTIN